MGLGSTRWIDFVFVGVKYTLFMIVKTSKVVENLIEVHAMPPLIHLLKLLKIPNVS